MTKEEIDKLFSEQFSIMNDLSDKLDLKKYYKFLEVSDYCNMLFMVYNLLDNDMKHYFYFKCIENGLEDYTLLFDSSIKNDVCNQIIDSGDLDLLNSVQAIKIRQILLLSENERKKAFENLNDRYKALAISSLATDEEKLSMLKYLENNYFIFTVISSLSSDDLKIKYISSMNFEENEFLSNEFYVALSSIKDDNSKYLLISKLIKNNVGRIHKYVIPLISFNNSDYIIKIIDDMDCEKIDIIRKENIVDNEIIFSDLDIILRKYYGNSEELKYSKDMFIQLRKKDPIYMSKVNIKLLNKNICEKFDKEYLDEIFLYPDIQDKLIKISFDTKKIDIISNLLNNFIMEYGNTRWNIFFEKIIDRVLSDEYSSLIDSLSIKEQKNMEMLYNLLKQNNDFCIQSESELIDLEMIKKNICNKLINSEEIDSKYEKISSLSDLEKKQYAVLQKIYGIDLDEARRLLSFYGDDIDNLKSEDYKTGVCKKFIRTISYILNEDNVDALVEIYNMDIELSKADINTIMIEQELQSAYMREYNNILFDPKKDGTVIKQEGDITFIDAGVDFNIIMTSIAAFYQKKIDNYKSSWTNTIDFCGSFIRNDMLGTAQIPNVCFGFSSMDERSLLFSHPSNMSSKARFFNTKSGVDKVNFCSPNTQINRRGEDFANGKESFYLYNEMVFKKNLNNSIKQPDYILVFREDGKISNIEEAIKSSNDFGGIPIVIVDKDKCAISELNKIKELIKIYKETKDEDFLYQIKTKIQNNMVSNNYFKEHIKDIVKELNLGIEIKKENPQKSIISSDFRDNQNEREKMISQFDRIDEVYGEISRRL